MSYEHIYNGKETVLSNDGKNIESNGVMDQLKIFMDSYRTIFDLSTDSIFIHDLKTGKIIDVNETTLKKFGYTKEEILELHVSDLSINEPPYTQKEAEEWIRKTIEQGTQRFEWLAKTKEGSFIWFENCLKKINIDGKERLIVFSRDITNWKKTETILKKRYQFEQILSRISTRFINPIDIDECIQTSLREIGELCNASRSYLFKIHDSNLMSNTHEWCAKGVSPQITELQKLPIDSFPWWMDMLQKGRIINVSDISEIPINGEKEKNILKAQNIKAIIVIPVMIDRNLIGFIGFDNTEGTYKWDEYDEKALGIFSQIISMVLSKKLIEEKVIHSEERYRMIFNSSTDSIFIHEFHTGKIVDVNQTVIDKFGYSKEEFKKLTVGDLSINIPPYTQKEAASWIRKAAEEGPQRFEWIARTKDGSLIWYENILQKSKIAGEDQVLVFGRDITDRKKIEETLKTNEKYYQEIYNAQINGFAIFKSIFNDHGEFVNYEFVDINNAYEWITGVKREEVIGKDIQTVFPGTEQSWIDMYGSVAITGETKTFDMYHGPTKKYYHCNVFRPWSTSDKFCVAFEDITEKINAEKVLRESEKKYHTYVDSAPDGIFIFDEQGRYQDVNPAGEKFSGYMKKELLDLSIIDLLVDDEHDSSKNFLTIIREQGRLNKILRFKRKDGVIRYWNADVVSLSKDQFLCYVKDVTDDKIAEEKLMETVKNLQTFESVAVERELKMIELKKEINSLCEKLSEQPKYSIPEV